MKLMKFVLVLLLGFWGNQVMGQTAMTTQDSIKASMLDKTGKPYRYVDNMPVFKGGSEKLDQWLETNVPYPIEAIKKGYQGRCFVRITVDCDGKIKDIMIERSSGYPILDEAALASIAKMPTWIPGSIYGKAVAVYFTIPIYFNLPK